MGAFNSPIQQLTLHAHQLTLVYSIDNEETTSTTWNGSTFPHLLPKQYDVLQYPTNAHSSDMETFESANATAIASEEEVEQEVDNFSK